MTTLLIYGMWVFLQHFVHRLPYVDLASHLKTGATKPKVESVLSRVLG